MNVRRQGMKQVNASPAARGDKQPALSVIAWKSDEVGYYVLQVNVEGFDSPYPQPLDRGGEGPLWESREADPCKSR